MRLRFACSIILAASAFLVAAHAAKKKTTDELTQTLELPRDPPMVAYGATNRLVFSVTPLSNKGLLTQQTREALKALFRLNGNSQLVHVRAFVAGSGDLRRVPQLVSEAITDRKMPLPSVSVVQTGGLPLEGAQVVLEAVSNGKKDVNSAGLIFVEAQTVTANSPSAPVQGLMDQSLAKLAGRIGNATALQVTCFVSDLSQAGTLNGAMMTKFPLAVTDLVQAQRASARAFAACEGVARGPGPAPIVIAPRLAFTGTQIAFGTDEQAARLAFQRLEHDLLGMGVTNADIVSMTVYPLSLGIADLAAKVRPPQGTLTNIPVEGVASLDSSFAVDAVGVAHTQESQ
jgi:enamine deaminase RidA (YjgF/YER057c/UK114 family)